MVVTKVRLLVESMADCWVEQKVDLKAERSVVTTVESLADWRAA